MIVTWYPCFKDSDRIDQFDPKIDEPVKFLVQFGSENRWIFKPVENRSNRLVQPRPVKTCSNTLWGRVGSASPYKAGPVNSCIYIFIFYILLFNNSFSSDQKSLKFPISQIHSIQSVHCLWASTSSRLPVIRLSIFVRLPASSFILLRRRSSHPPPP